MKYKKTIIFSSIILILVLYAIYSLYVSPTYIALIGFKDFQYVEMAKVKNNSMIKVHRIEREDIVNTDFSKYSFISLFGMGLNLSDEQKNSLKKGMLKKAKVFVYASTNTESDICNIFGEELKKVSAYMDNGGAKNIENLFNYIRVNWDKKKFFIKKIEEPEYIPFDTIFHKGKDNYFETFTEYQNFYEKNNLYKKDRPKVCFITSIKGGPRSVERQFVDNLITMLEEKKLNVYSVSGFMKRHEFLQEIKPDAVIYVPHGRLNPGRGDVTTAWLKEQNIPLFCPIDISEPFDKWQEDQQGLAGGMLSQSIVVPEIDGGIEPFAISAQFKNKDGFYLSLGIESRLKTFVNRVCNWIELKIKKNSEKKIAILYFKGSGNNSLVAGGLEVAPSLLNILKTLQKNGYNTGTLPETPEDLMDIIQKQGPVIMPYAEGRIEEFKKDGNPELIDIKNYEKWAKAQIPIKNYNEVLNQYGEPSEDYLSVFKDDKYYIAIPRVKFGNIVILPQLLPAIGENTSAIIHGAKTAPPHSYIAEYLWIRNGFKADSIMHFGTHGSFEFLPWKQTGLSSYDWSDSLISDLPHPYFYTISNIGEAVIAKRRSYATIISHLTPPFMESGIYGPFEEIHDKIHNYMSAQDAELKKEYSNSIKEIILKNNIEKDLNFENLETKELTQKNIDKIHNYIHIVEEEKVSEGLYTAGIQYNKFQAENTAKLMTIDTISFSMAKKDLELKKINQEQFDDKHFFEKNYKEKALDIIEKMLLENKKADDFISADERKLLNEFENSNMKLDNDQFFADMLSMSENNEIISETSNLSDKDRDKIMTLIASITISKEKTDYIKSLKDNEKLAKAINAIQPENIDKIKRISKMIPAMGKAMEILENKDIKETVTYLKNTNANEFIFELLNNPTKMKEIEYKKKMKIEEIINIACKEDYLETIFTLYSKDKTQILINKTEKLMINALKKFEFYKKNKQIIIESKGNKADIEAVKAIIKNKDSYKVLLENENIIKSKITSEKDKRKSLYNYVKNYKEAIENVAFYKQALLNSTESEMQAILNSFSGGYIYPSPGGDPISNTQSVPTGKNLYAIDAEKAPTPEAWKIGVKLAKVIIQRKLDKTGEYPKKVAFTMWGGEFIRQQGIQIATILYLLGTEPVSNSRNSVYAVKLIPSEELNRPRIDVFVQTSGQFRDIASSRIFLIDEAVKTAKNAYINDKFPNYIYENSLEGEKKLVEKGFSPEEARLFSTARIFGGVNGNYGTGITGMVESGDKWEDKDEIADLYIKNMGAIYTKENWGMYKTGLFESSASGTDTISFGRSTNSWGPLSLDHVYEFMGGVSSAMTKITGKEPDALFTDVRNKSNSNIQSVDEAIWTESRTTILNPKWIKSLQKGSASSANQFSEIFRNTYGWNSLRPSAIDNELWDNFHSVYIEDKYNLKIQEFFEKENPYALQEMTSVMLETARKGMWKTSEENLKKIAEIHVKLINKYNTSCSGFVCNNSKLQDFITQKVSPENQKQYKENIEKTLKSQNQQSKKTIKLKKEEITLNKIKEIVKSNIEAVISLGIIILLFAAAVFIGTKKRR
ncbi:MAG: cobaltochelatase subunit CobN [Candidatus Muirbacterium halophilum]|nr:cobaltochelatase subunit CobN [Candidatus Muirbacterium halophilum]MCK9475896.1 cobaltochelatase subunit CobN [Candidatus Muirbacterium halophilum]